MSTGNSVGPCASVLSPAQPLHFEVLANLRGLFNSISPGQPSNAKGIDYNQVSKSLIASLSPWDHASPDNTQQLYKVGADGSVALFTPSATPSFGMNRDVESKVATVPAGGPPVSTGGFTAGDVFVPGGQNLSAISTTIASGSNGASLPQATIFVSTTAGFASSGIVFVQTGQGFQRVSYSGKTSTTLTGCSGGGGVMSTGGVIQNCSPNSIYRITGSPAGFSAGYPAPWADQIDSASGGLWGGLVFDGYGSFSGRLIAVSKSGKIYLLDSSGAPVLATATNGVWADLAVLLPDVGGHVEGCAVAPASFGPYAGWLVVGIENDAGNDDLNSGLICVVAPPSYGSQVALPIANIGFATESLQFAPIMGSTFYQTEIDFWSEARNRIYSASAGQLLAHAGSLFAVNEMAGEFWTVAYDGVSSSFRQRFVGRLPSSWSSGGFWFQGTECEASCFAQQTPVLPGFGGWQVVNGDTNFQTSQGPSACVVPANQGQNYQTTAWRLYVAALCSLTQGSYVTGRIYFQSRLLGGAWGPTWTDASSGAPFTPRQVPPAIASQDGEAYIFAADLVGDVWYRRITSPTPPSSWVRVPGAATCDANTGPAAALVNGRVVVATLSGGQLGLVELGVGGRSGGGYGIAAQQAVGFGTSPGQWWTSIGLVPSSAGLTVRSPTVVQFQGELWVLAVAVAGNSLGYPDGSVLAVSRSAGGDWGGWGEIPAAGIVSTSVGASTPVDEIGFLPSGVPRPANAQLVLAARGTSGTGSNTFVNAASPSGVWTSWASVVGGTIQGPPAVAVAPVANSLLGTGVFVFAKGNAASANVWTVNS